MLATRRAVVVAVVEPDEHIRDTVRVLLEIEFGLTVQTAPDIQSVLSALPSGQLLAALVTPKVEVLQDVPTIVYGGVPLDAVTILSGVRAALAKKLT